MKKRLLKDLPFWNFIKWDVFSKWNWTYYIDMWETIYESGGSSSNWINYLEQNEKDIVDLVWDNESWFVESKIDHIQIVAKNDKIEINFSPLDKRDAQDFAKWIQATLIEHFWKSDRNMVWNKFAGFTTSLK